MPIVLKEIEREDVSRQKKQEKTRQTENAVKNKAEPEAQQKPTVVPEIVKSPTRGISSFF